MIENKENSNLIEEIEAFATDFFSFLKELFVTIVSKSSLPSFTANFDDFATDLQIILFKVILLLLLISIVLSGICWRRYGDVITEKFIKPSK